MGGHYGSIHIRTENANDVRAALEVFAREEEAKFLLAPVIDGWVSAFPHENGQDFGVAAALAERIKAPFLHCLVHDDDVFAYQFYEGGVLTDQYNSCPEYFGGEAAPKGGDVAALRSIIPEAEKQGRLKALLESDRFTFEMDRMDQFATILGLPNAVSAYEYLQDGERDDIKGWKEFVHIPDLGAERAAKRAEKARIKSEMKRLAKTGTLILELVGGKTSHRLFYQTPFWTLNRATGEVLLMWSGNPMAPATSAPLLRVDPVTGGVSETKWNASSRGCSFAASPNGRWLAVGCAFGDWKTQLWDLESAQLASEISQSRAVEAVCFSPDGQMLFSLSEQIVTLAYGPDLKTVETIKLAEYGRAMAVHPQGEYLVVNSQGKLAIVHIPSRWQVKTVWIDGQPGPERSLAELMGPKAYASFIGTLSAQVPASELKEHEIRLQGHFLPKQEVFSLTFSADGKWLICGTRAGVCVFDWNNVLASADMTPIMPLLYTEGENSFDYDGKSFPAPRLIYSVIYDAPRNRVLFSGLEGKVRFLDLAKGIAGDLLVPPLLRPFWRLELTSDRQALVGTATHPVTGKKDASKFQIWSYPALCKLAGIPF